jgi:hypothetical protein
MHIELQLPLVVAFDCEADTLQIIVKGLVFAHHAGGERITVVNKLYTRCQVSATCSRQPQGRSAT